MSENVLTDAPKAPARRKRWVYAAVAAVAVLAVAALTLAILAGSPRARAGAVVRALSSGDGASAARLLPGEVLSQVALELGVDRDQAERALADTLSVPAYGDLPANPSVRAGESRELTGQGMEDLRGLYGQLGLELKKAATVDVRVSASGVSGVVPVTVVKLGLRWYADYTSLEDTAYRIAYLGKTR